MLSCCIGSKKLIVVSGLPATGKTILSKQIASAFAIPLISKDAIKESLFDSLGIGDRDWSSRLGAASFDLMFVVAREMMQRQSSFVLEAYFSTRAHLAIKTLVSEFDYGQISLECVCKPEVAANRFRERWNSGERHRGHVDNENFDVIEQINSNGIAIVKPRESAVLEVDTSCLETLDVPKILKFIVSQGDL